MNNLKLTKDECKQWIEDLRSGEYKQCKGKLKTANQHGVYFCCLGVLKETQDKPRHKAVGGGEQQEILSYDVLSKNTQHTLIKMNDGGISFSEISDHIEKRILPRRK